MAATPEIARPTPEQVQEIPTVPEIPPEIEKGLNVQVVNKTFTAQVNDDKGKPLIQTPPTKVINITPPASQATLLTWAKGPITLSLSWLGMFWVRMIKKALHFGWSVEEKK